MPVIRTLPASVWKAAGVAGSVLTCMPRKLGGPDPIGNTNRVLIDYVSDMNRGGGSWS